MNTFAVEIWFDEAKLCNFYSVRREDSDESETDRFFEKFGADGTRYSVQAYELLRLITHSIGEVYGATDDFSDRSKNEAQALPPRPKRWIPEIDEIGIHFPLRLYCYRISESIVVLFNGGVKDRRTDQESKDVRLKFYEAQIFAQRIARALQDETLIIADDKRTITDFQGNRDFVI